MERQAEPGLNVKAPAELPCGGVLLRGSGFSRVATGSMLGAAMSFEPPNAPPWLISGFVFLPMLVMVLAQWGLSLGARRAGAPRWLHGLCAAGLVVAMVFSLTVAARGSLTQFDRVPPPFLPLTFGCIVVWVLTATSRLSSGLQQLPLAALVGFQSFRLPLELMMHAAAEAGVMPPQMSYSGYNFDIVSGAGAALLAVLLALNKAPRWLLLGWNALSTALLAAIVVIAVLSAPPFLAFGREQANTWVAHAPFVWLPTVLVPAAISGHVLLWRRLLQRENSSSHGQPPSARGEPRGGSEAPGKAATPAAPIDSRA